MQQTPRNNDRIVWRAIVISRLVIIAGIRRVFSQRAQKANPVDTDTVVTWDQQEEVVDDGRYFVWESILADWVISKVRGSSYTHLFVDDDDNEFGLKSSSINLNDYDWDVSIKGEIIDVIDEIPVAQVVDILAKVDPANNDQGKNSWFTYFSDAGLGIDLWPSQWFVVERQEDDVLVIDKSDPNQWQTKLTVSPFVCTPGDGLKDCEALRTNFIANDNDSFVSSKGDKYYRLTETDTRVMFDANKWYYIRTGTDWSVTDFVDMLVMVNNDSVSAWLADEAPSSCRTLQYRIWSTSTNDVKLWSIDNDIMSANISWVSKDWSKIISCNYSIQLWSDPKYDLLSTSISDNPNFDPSIEEPAPESVEEVEEKNGEDESSEDQEVEEIKDPEVEEDQEEKEDSNVAVVLEEWDYAWRLSFPSVKGYTMYFSNPKVGYAGANLWSDEALQAWGTTCSYWVKVTTRANLDNITTAPDSIIYECLWAIDAAALPAWSSVIGSNGSTTFVKRDLTATLWGMTVKIQ